MATITVLKNNVPTGPFTREQVADKLQGGEMSLEDLAFVEGLGQWTPLREVLARVDAVALPPIPPIPVATAPAYSYAATMQPPGHLQYAGFWIRFVAYIVDGLILSIPIFIIVLIFGVIAGIIGGMTGAIHSLGNSGSEPAVGAVMGVSIALMELVFFVFIIVITWLYFAMLESSPAQATYGKRLLGLQVTNLSGGRISFGQASGRFFAKILSKMIFYVGFIMAGFTERKQGLHDMIAGTLVVRK
jgi:uncharacterized RDD family membrane protein YckC